VPLGFRPQVLPGRAHDMQFLQGGTAPFPHLAKEMFLADLGYVGMSHAAVPYKSGEDEGQLRLGVATIGPDSATELTQFADDDEAQVQVTHARYWNKVHSKFRSRIERKFSALERWRWLKQTSFSAPVVAKALRICVSLEAYVGFRSPLPYPQEVDATKWWERMLSCVCQPKDPRNVAAAKAWRTTTVRQLFADGSVPSTRPSSP